MTPGQSRAARALVDLTQPKLAAASGLGLSTIVDFERSRREISPDALSAIRSALETAGVIFVEENGEGPGVRLRKQAAISLNHAIEREEANMAAVDAKDAKAKRAAKSSTSSAGPATDIVEMMDAAIEEHEKGRKR